MTLSIEENDIEGIHILQNILGLHILLKQNHSRMARLSSFISIAFNLKVYFTIIDSVNFWENLFWCHLLPCIEDEVQDCKI